MTAEIAVMNTAGVALAADSAASIGGEANKIFASENKLFQLSQHAPVAIMIYGDVNFLDIPWETVVKVYREQRGHKTFAKLSGYADDFFKFIRSNTSMFPHSMRNEYVKFLIVYFLDGSLRNLEKKLEKENEESKKKSGKDLKNFVHKTIMEQISEAKKYPKIKGFGSAVAQNFRKKYAKVIKSYREHIFNEYALLPKTHRVIETLVVEKMLRTDFRELPTGIVFAGFGEDEYLPSLLSYEVEGMLGARLRRAHRESVAIEEREGWIETFAQRDAMELFLDGIHPQYRLKVAKCVDELFTNIVDGLNATFHDISVKESIQKRFSKLFTEAADGMIDKIVGIGKDSWQSKNKIVGTMPVDELARTAETLVNLTQFRLRISDEKETVGGPIDVAVITKGDGFVWVKRKAHFPKELNPHLNP